MGSFETHLRGGPFIAPANPSDQFERKKLIVPEEEKDFSTGNKIKARPSGLPNLIVINSKLDVVKTGCLSMSDLDSDNEIKI